MSKIVRKIWTVKLIHKTDCKSRIKLQHEERILTALSDTDVNVSVISLKAIKEIRIEFNKEQGQIKGFNNHKEDQLSETKVFAALDLESGYHQVTVEEADRDKMDFYIRERIYQ
uniref:Uncharacterized protein n=1 Tax=Vespula pensylvanica TaxID=30213 RepID=A0A834UH23_VESPE|nr:hypothetical protein H0235_001098 [Vespula pensylvanica]